MDSGAISHLSALSGVTGLRQPAEQLAARREMVQAVAAIKKAEVFGPKDELTFGFDRDNRRMLLRIVNRKTGEVVAQLPPEHVLKVAQYLGTMQR